MAQSTSPSMSLQDGSSDHHHSTMKSDQDVPIDPSIAASSPTYPHGQYSPYPQQDMSHGYPQHPQGAMYAQPRPDWAGYAGHPQQPSPMGYGVNGQSTPTSHAPPGPPRHPVSICDFRIRVFDGEIASHLLFILPLILRGWSSGDEHAATRLTTQHHEELSCISSNIFCINCWKNN